MSTEGNKLDMAALLEMLAAELLKGTVSRAAEDEREGDETVPLAFSRPVDPAGRL